MKITKVAVIGAGNMGSGIAQKIATEGVPVVLVDATTERAEAGKQRIATLLGEAVERRLFRPEQVEAILARVTPTGTLGDVAGVDLVIEAIFEDLNVKRKLFEDLSAVCRPDAILATNTSSFLVADVAAAASHPERVIGLHYFYHPAKNRLVEVIGHSGSSQSTLRAAWAFQEKVGKTPIASEDAPGFVVNRFFVPWLNEAVRLHEEGVGIPTIEAASKAAFGVGMGPFELMNVTGVPITLHATASLGESLGSFYGSAAALKPQVDSGEPWTLEGDVDEDRFEEVGDRLWGVVFHVVARLLEEGVSTPEDIDIGAKVGLRWPMGPFEKINETGGVAALAAARKIEARYDLDGGTQLSNRSGEPVPFPLRRVRLEIEGAIATITVNRPDQLNAIDPETVEQLEDCFDRAQADPAVTGIVLAGAGKAFVAGADVKFFVDRIQEDAVGEVVAFAANGQRVYRRIEESTIPVVCRLDGLALGGGAELALACHVIVGTPKATLGFPETGIGIYPGLGGTQRLARRLGTGLSRYFLYTGAVLGAEDLSALRVAWKVVDPDDLDDAVLEALSGAPRQESMPEESLPEPWATVARFLGEEPLAGLRDRALPDCLGRLKFAKKLGFKAPLGLAAVERLTAVAAAGDHRAGLEAETAGLEAIFSSRDALEGLSSVLERRRPTFNGS